MNSNCRSFQPTKLTVWGSILLMACTYSVAMAEVTRASTLETNLNQPGYLETKDTPPPDQGENYPTQAESNQSLSLSLNHLKSLALTSHQLLTNQK